MPRLILGLGAAVPVAPPGGGNDLIARAAARWKAVAATANVRIE